MQSDRYQRYGDYILDREEQLGSGSYGTVYKGYYLSPEQRLTAIAIKEACLHEQIMKEIRTLETLEHRNIVKYLDYREHKGYVYMFMELCDGSLDKLLERNPSAEERLGYYRQIVAAVRFMYSRSVLHRDIKPSNILVKGNIVKIADFGTAKFVEMGQLHHETLVGTPLFCSPEMLRVRLGEASRYTEQSQIWSMGLLLYYIFNFDIDAPPEERTRRSLPWHGKTEKQLLEQIKKEQLKFKKDTPEEIKSLIQRMLVMEPEERLSFTQLLTMGLLKNTQEPESEEVRPDTTIKLTLINRAVVDDKLKDRLREAEEQEVQQMEHVAVYRQKAMLIYNVYSRLMELGVSMQLCQSTARAACDLLREYLTLGMTAFTCSGYRDKELIKQLEAKHPAIKKSSEACQETFHTQIKAVLRENQADIDQLHSHSKLNNENRNKLWMLYDLLIVYTLEQHWVKEQPRKLEAHYQLRRLVRDSTLIARVQKGLKAILDF